MADTFEFAIVFGWAAPKIDEQMKAFGIDVPAKEVKAWQAQADAIMLLVFADLMNEGWASKARNKMTRKVENWLIENEYMGPVSKEQK